MEHVLAGQDLLCGCAGLDGMGDPHWRALWQHLAESEANSNTFLLVREDMRQRMTNLFQAMEAPIPVWADAHIFVVSYGQAFNDLGPFLQSLVVPA